MGASGVGKSTLANELSKKLGIRWIESDDFYFHKSDPPFEHPRSPLERNQLLEAELKKQAEWVLSGGAGTWEPKIDFKQTLTVFLYLPLELRLQRLTERELRLYGDRIRPGGDMEAIFKSLIFWTRGYDDSSAEGTVTLLRINGS